MAFDADGRLARSGAWVDRATPPRCTSTGATAAPRRQRRAGISTSHGRRQRDPGPRSFEYAAVALSMLGSTSRHPFYAAVDAPWWRRSHAQVGLAARTRRAASPSRPSAPTPSSAIVTWPRAMNVADIVAFTLASSTRSSPAGMSDNLTAPTGTAALSFTPS